ncbi:O-antigen ligase family protein [Clostridium botulinum]|nr:O-antigen ligase family protein [Clostridium botulinum]
MKEKKSFLKILEYYNILLFCLSTWKITGNYKALSIIYFSGMIVLFLIVICKERVNFFSRVKNNKALLFVCFILLISSLSSLEKFNTIQNSIFIFTIILYSIILSILYESTEFYNMLIKYYIFSIIVSLIVIYFLPNIGTTYYDGEIVVKGVYSHKNILARNMIISIIIFINSISVKKCMLKKIFYLCFTILSITLIVLSKSTTGLIYAITFVALYIIITKKKKVTTIIEKAIYIVVLLFNMFVIWISNPINTNRLAGYKIFNKDFSFTGRTGIWNFAIDYIKSRPLNGYGYCAFWQNYNIQNNFYGLYGFNPPHAHNGYLDCILNAGIILLISLLFIIIKIIKNSNNTIYERSTFLIMIFVLLINLTEESFLQGGTIIFPIIIFFNYAQRKIR